MAKFGLVEAVTLMDTGAEASVMQEIILDGLPKDLIIDTQPPPIRYCVGPDGGKMSIRDVTTLEFTLNGWTFQHPFLILRDLKKPIILGSDFFCQQNAVLYYQDRQPCEIILDSEYRIPLFRADKITERKYPDVPSIQCGPNYISAKTLKLPGCKNREPAYSLTTSIHNKIDGMTPEHRAQSPRRYLSHRQDRNKGFHRLHNEAHGRRMLRGPARCQTPDRPITAVQSNFNNTVNGIQHGIQPGTRTEYESERTVTPKRRAKREKNKRRRARKAAIKKENYELQQLGFYYESPQYKLSSKYQPTSHLTGKNTKRRRKGRQQAGKFSLPPTNLASKPSWKTNKSKIWQQRQPQDLTIKSVRFKDIPSKHHYKTQYQNSTIKNGENSQPIHNLVSHNSRRHSGTRRHVKSPTYSNQGRTPTIMDFTAQLLEQNASPDLEKQWHQRHLLTKLMELGIPPNQAEFYLQQQNKKKKMDEPEEETDDDEIIMVPPKQSTNHTSPKKKKTWQSGQKKMEQVLKEKPIRILKTQEPTVSTVACEYNTHRFRLPDAPLPPLVWDDEEEKDTMMIPTDNTTIPSRQQKEITPPSGETEQNAPDSHTDSEQEKIAGSVPDIGTEDSHTRAKLMEVLRQNEHLFAPTDLDLGETHLMEFGIETGDHPPIKQKAYSTPWSQKDVIREYVDSMLQAGVIVPSASPWASPILLVDKPKDTKRAGKPIYRFCVDFRRLNSITKKNSHPLPNITEVIDGLGGAKIFSSLDLKSGYWQIPLKKEDMEKTAFTTGDALYEFTRVPFGLANAPSAFANLIGAVLHGLQYKFCLAYLDDIIIYSSTIEEHLEHLQIVFKRLEEAGLKLKPTKCSYLCKQLDFLGHVISANGVSVCPDKVKAIAELETPVNVKNVRAFLGMCSYYRKYIRDMGTIAKPLTELTKKNQKFEWTEKCQEAFETLKHALATAPVLAYPNRSEDHPFVLYTDGSLTAIGAILAQQDPEGNERVIQYFSSVLPESMKNYSISEIECYAIVRALTKFRTYLMGRRFKCYTDHSPLVTIQKTKLNNRRIQRWAAALTEFDMEIIYKPGKVQKADFLSRIPYTGTLPKEDPDFDAENKYLPEISMLQSEEEYLSPLQGVGEDLCHNCLLSMDTEVVPPDQWKEETFQYMIHHDYQPPLRICAECEVELQHEDPIVDFNPYPYNSHMEPYPSGITVIPPVPCIEDHDLSWDGSFSDESEIDYRWGERLFSPTATESAEEEALLEDTWSITELFDPKPCNSPNPRIENTFHSEEHPLEATINLIDVGNPEWREMDKIQEHPHATINEVMGPAPEEVTKEQKTDTEIVAIIEYIKAGNSMKDYCVEDNVLYHLATPIMPDPEPRIQIVVPKKLIGKILNAYHEPYHWGIHKNYAALHQRFYWKTMYADCVKHVQRCLPCAKTKLKKSRAPLRNQRPIPAHPFAEVMVDTVGKLPETTEGYKYIVTFIDIFSGWVEAFPAKDKSAESVAKIIATELIPRHSTPPVLRSDNGTEYINELLDQLSVNLGIHRISCLPYSPWSQGPIERFNQTLKHGLKRRIGEKHSDWILHLPAVLFACRVAPQERHGLSPFSVLYGREPYLLADEMFAPKMEYRGGSWSKRQIQRMNQAFALVRNRTQETRRKQKERYDRRVDPIQLTEGTHVWYYDSTNIRGPSKFHSHWRPMYKVVSFKSPEAIVIQHQPTGKQKCVHRNHLRPVYPSQAWDANYGTQRKPVAHRVMPSRKLKDREQQNEETMFLDDDIEPEDDDIRQWISSTPVPPPPSRQNSMTGDPESRPGTPASNHDATAIPLEQNAANPNQESDIRPDIVDMDIDQQPETESDTSDKVDKDDKAPPARTPTPPPQTPYNLRSRQKLNQDTGNSDNISPTIESPTNSDPHVEDTGSPNPEIPVTPTRTHTPPPPLPPFWKKPRRPPPPIPTTPGGTPFPPFDQSTLRPTPKSPKTTGIITDSSEEETQTGVVIGNPYNRPIIPKVTRDPAPLDASVQGPACRTRSRTSYLSPKNTKRPRPESSDEESESIIPTKKVHVQSSNYPVSDESHWKYPPQDEREIRIERPPQITNSTENITQKEEKEEENQVEETMDISTLEITTPQTSKEPVYDPVQCRKRKFKAIRRFAAQLTSPFDLFKKQ